MEANTPATPSSPGGNPIQDKARPDKARSGKADGPETAGADKAGTDKVTTPARPKGPNASAIVVGLVAMLIAGLIIANETMHLRVDWSQVGPGTIVGIGLVLVVLGAIGLVRRHEDA
jgi:hypothetical protein